MFVALVWELGMREDQGVYLDDTGHMSGDGDAVLPHSAGSWAATAVRRGPA
jgi:hypothetical protein